MTDAKTVTEPRTRTLEVPGATLTYDIREANAASDAPVLMMIGSPMGAGGFTTLAEYFQDRTVVTYDPRGAGRSEKTDDAEQSTPEEHADDLHRLISALGGRPVDIFASSGGAVNGLVLVAEHPEQVRTLVAHEPPSAQVLPDREQALAAAVDIHETYERDGIGPAMAKFIALTSLKGPIPDDFAGGPGPDPADFGLPTEDDGTRNDPLGWSEHRHGHAPRARLRRVASCADAHRYRGRRRVGGRADLPRGARRRGTTWAGSGHLPQPPRRLPRRRVRHAGRSRRVRRHPAGGPRRGRLTLGPAPRMGSSTGGRGLDPTPGAVQPSGR